MEILETVASFLMIPSDTLHPFIFFFFFPFLKFRLSPVCVRRPLHDMPFTSTFL